MENVQTMGVKRAAGFIRQMNADDRIKEIARVRENAKMAEYSAIKKFREEGLKQGMQEGLQKGLQEGKKEGKLEALTETAINLLKNGFTAEQVANGTKLPVSEVLELQKSI
jgi:predicted transposase/invertase (TIGR01784 family)